RDRQLAAPVDSETLQDLVRNELATKKHTATEGLVWLNRGLDFTAQALRQNLTNSGEEMSVSFRAAYGNTLSKHHSFMIKPIFSAAMSATPYRKDFYAKLGDDQARVEKELNAWLSSLENIVKILNDFLASKEAKW
ncbi:putative glycolipid transfer protein HET-C2, partial [Aureobasidium melanogenum]